MKTSGYKRGFPNLTTLKCIVHLPYSKTYWKYIIHSQFTGSDMGEGNAMATKS